MNVLAFFAHPDDETIMAGGTLALLANQGARVHYLCATRGEGGEAGEPPICTRQGLPAVRAAEFACAVGALNGSSHHFLDYVDPTVGAENELYPFSDDPQGVADALRAHLLHIKIDALISHGSKGEYGHPAHLLCHQASRQAVLSLGSRAPLFYTVQPAFDEHPKPHIVNPDDPAHLVLNTESVTAQVLQAIGCHRTQHALFVRNASKRLGRAVDLSEIVVCREGLHCALPAVEGSPQDRLAELLRSSGCIVEG